jgi:hypothetical protein
LFGFGGVKPKIVKKKNVNLNQVELSSESDEMEIVDDVMPLNGSINQP